MNTYAIFHKDTRILARQMVSALVVQAFIMVFLPIMAHLTAAALSNSDKFPKLEVWFPTTQIAFCGLIALIAAALWDVEERMGKNDLFLRRLPVSFLRIRAEKTVAGLAIILATVLIEWLWYALAIQKSSSSFYLSILLIGLYAYMVGIPLSRFFSQTITVILTGTILIFIGWFLLNNYLPTHQEDALHMLSLGIVILVLLLVFTFIIIIKRKNKDRVQGPSELLIFTHQKENQILLFLSLGLVCAIPVTFSLITTNLFVLLGRFFLLMIFVLPMAIGVSTYNQEEKHGLRSVLYYHPISLHTLFWTRWLHGCRYCLVPFLGYFILLTINNDSFWYFLSHNNIFIAFLSALGPESPLTNLLGSTFPPGHGLEMLVTLGCFVYLPFVCGMLFTHAIRNYVYAFMETIVALLIILFFCLWTLFSNTHILSMVISLQTFPPLEMKAYFPPFPWLLIALIVGLTLAAWRTATDRELLNSDTLHRQMYVGRLFLSTLAIIAILFKTGWYDLFYLITGMNFFLRW